MKETLTVRRAGIQDIQNIEALEKLCFAAPWSYDNILYAVNDENTVFLIAESEGEFAGYISGNNAAGEMYVGNLAVLPEKRQRGVGKKLVGELLRISENLHCEFVSLEVRESNVGARHLYEMCGFNNRGIRPRFYGNPAEGACIYTKYLKI